MPSPFVVTVFSTPAEETTVTVAPTTAPPNSSST
jgi:hypothetical protein